MRDMTYAILWHILFCFVLVVTLHGEDGEGMWVELGQSEVG